MANRINDSLAKRNSSTTRLHKVLRALGRTMKTRDEKKNESTELLTETKKLYDKNSNVIISTNAVEIALYSYKTSKLKILKTTD